MRCEIVRPPPTPLVVLAIVVAVVAAALLGRAHRSTLVRDCVGATPPESLYRPCR